MFCLKSYVMEPHVYFVKSCQILGIVTSLPSFYKYNVICTAKQKFPNTSFRYLNLYNPHTLGMLGENKSCQKYSDYSCTYSYF